MWPFIWPTFLPRRLWRTRANATFAASASLAAIATIAAIVNIAIEPSATVVQTVVQTQSAITFVGRFYRRW